MKPCKRALLWGFGLLVFVQVASWMAWGNAQLVDIVASDIVEVTGGHFALDSESCPVAVPLIPKVCNELRKVKSIREQTRRKEAGEWRRICPRPNECFGEGPENFWFEDLRSYPAVASVEFGTTPEVLDEEGKTFPISLSGHGTKLTYYWVLGVWIRSDWVKTTWIS